MGQTTMRRIALALLLSTIASAQSHQRMNVMYDAVWQREESKSCVMPISRTASRDGKTLVHSKKLFCSTSGKYSRMAVSLNSAAETAFVRSNKWGIPLDCRRTDKKQIACVYAGD